MVVFAEPLGGSWVESLEKDMEYRREMDRRRELGVLDNGQTSNNHERPMNDITPKPAVQRANKMIAGPIERVTQCK